MGSLGKFAYQKINQLEASLASLNTYTKVVNNTRTTYLSNMETETLNAQKTVVLIHGFSADKYVWNRFAKHLSSNFKLIIPDLLGHGDTPYSCSGDYSVPTQVEHLLALLDLLGVEEFAVVGSSMGGMMCAQLLKVCPDRIISAVLIDPAGAASDHAKEVIASGVNPFVHKNFESFMNFYDLSMQKPPYIPNFILKHIASIYIAKQTQYQHMFFDFFNIAEFFTDKDTIIGNNSLLIWGQEDKLLPLSDMKVWQTVLQAETITYKGVGHLPILEIPQTCAYDVKQFLLST